MDKKIKQILEYANRRYKFATSSQAGAYKDIIKFIEANNPDINIKNELQVKKCPTHFLLDDCINTKECDKLGLCLRTC